MVLLKLETRVKHCEPKTDQNPLGGPNEQKNAVRHNNCDAHLAGTLPGAVQANDCEPGENFELPFFQPLQ
jgi:hypothetical protein